MIRIYSAAHYLKKYSAMDLQSALDSITSKATEKKYKQIFSSNMARGEFVVDRDGKLVALADFLANYKNDLQHFISSRDIPARYQAITVIWIKNHVLLAGPSDLKVLPATLGTTTTYMLTRLENYFQIIDYLPSQLKNVLTMSGHEIYEAVSQGMLIKQEKDKISFSGSAFQQKAKEGTELVGSTEEFNIYKPHNMWAACSLGSNTHWCTSVRDEQGNAFERYYKPSDPLYILISKENPREKYQVHIGSDQAMDYEDTPVNKEKKDDLIGQIQDVLAPSKYNSELISAPDLVDQINEALEEDSDTGNLNDLLTGLADLSTSSGKNKFMDKAVNYIQSLGEWGTTVDGTTLGIILSSNASDRSKQNLFIMLVIQSLERKHDAKLTDAFDETYKMHYGRPMNSMEAFNKLIERQIRLEHAKLEPDQAWLTYLDSKLPPETEWPRRVL